MDLDVVAPEPALLGDLEDRAQVSIGGVDSAVGHEPEEVELFVGFARRVGGAADRGVLVEGAVLDRAIDPRDLLPNDPPRPNVGMPHLRVSHQSEREPHLPPRARQEGRGEFLLPTKDVLRGGEAHGVPLGVGALAEAVEDRQQNRGRLLAIDVGLSLGSPPDQRIGRKEGLDVVAHFLRSRFASAKEWSACVLYSWAFASSVSAAALIRTFARAPRRRRRGSSRRRARRSRGYDCFWWQRRKRARGPPSRPPPCAPGSRSPRRGRAGSPRRGWPSPRRYSWEARRRGSPSSYARVSASTSVEASVRRRSHSSAVRAASASTASYFLPFVKRAAIATSATPDRGVQRGD